MKKSKVNRILDEFGNLLNRLIADPEPMN